MRHVEYPEIMHSVGKALLSSRGLSQRLPFHHRGSLDVFTSHYMIRGVRRAHDEIRYDFQMLRTKLAIPGTVTINLDCILLTCQTRALTGRCRDT